MSDYVKLLGYMPRKSGEVVECAYCGHVLKRAGDVMRGHRRRCTVAPSNPYTPGVCDA